MTSQVVGFTPHTVEQGARWAGLWNHGGLGEKCRPAKEKHLGPRLHGIDKWDEGDGALADQRQVFLEVLTPIAFCWIAESR